MAVGVGDGTTVTFGTSGFTALIIDIDGPSPSRAEVDQTHLGSTGWKTFIPAGTVDPGSYSMNIQYDPTVTIPITAVAETMTIDPAGSGSTLSFSGFISSVNHTFAIDEMMGANITCKISGAITGI